MRKSAFENRVRAALVCLLLVLTFSCGPPREEYAGQYEAAGDESLKGAVVFLELKEDGQAIQRVGDDEVNFTWKVKGDEIRLHTKSGGILVGTIENGTIKLQVPGRKALVFKKTE